MAHEAKSPYVTTFLSLLAPGLGHVYTGRIVPGLAFSGGAVAVGMLGTAAAVVASSSTSPTLVVAAGCWLVLWLIGAIDAFRGVRPGAAPPAGAPRSGPARSEYDR